MRKKIKQLMKRSLAGIAALAMMVSCLPSMGLPAQAKEAQPVSVSNFTSRISDEIVLENTGGDNLVLLQSLSAEDEFVFGADVTFTNLDEQQSAALIFGIKDNALDDSHAIKANIHARIDWNVPARVWGYGTDELRCPGESGQANTFFADNGINVTQKFRMEVSVQKNAENRYVLTYSLTNTAGEKVTAAQGILNDSYTGGRFGLMTYSSRAVFSNITVDGQKYGALESTGSAQTIHGINGDAHIVSNVYMEGGKAFTYETDVDLAADTCSAALTFGIQNKQSPADSWIGANFNFNDNNGAGGARVFKVNNGATDIGSAVLNGVLDKSKTIHLKLQVSETGLVTFELYNTNNAANKVTVSGTVSDYQGGYLGLLTFDSSATFRNITYTVEEEPEETEPVVTEPVVTEPVVTEPVVTEPVVTEPTDEDGIPDSFGATLENGVYVLDNCYGYVFEIDDVNGTIDGEDATLITTSSAYESCNPNWAVSVQLRPNVNDNQYNVVKVVVCPGTVSAAGITLADGDVVLVVHSASSYPGSSENWLSKIAAVALKEGDVIQLASDNSTATVVGPFDPDADGDGIQDSFGATEENGIYVLDNCYGYVFEIDDVNGTIDGEDATLITTASAYESCNPNWAISVQLRPNGNANQYSVVKVVECPGTVSAAGITLADGDVVLVVHSASSYPGSSENWLSKIAAVALKNGDIIELASDKATATVIGPGEAVPDESSYKTNLGELTYMGGEGNWAFTENGLYSDATGNGDCFAFSQVTGTNFVYSTDIDFDGTEGAAALVFRSNQDLDNKECYAVNIDVGSHKCKFWRWQENEALQLIDEKEVPAATDEKYTLKVVAYDSWILYYVNDQLVASTGDYVLQPGNKGQDTVIKEGCFGILNWNSKVTFQNTYYKELTGDFNPILTDITVTSSVGTVEEKTQFTPTEPITLQYVKNDASKVNIQVTRASSDAVVEIMDANGTVYAGGKNIPVSEGSNYITVTSTVTAEDGTEATATYRVNVHRFKEDEVYYNEAYRSQYHYSVKEGWANDPNGLVYYNGTYHMFYQFYDDIVWGPMHWAHATSTDLIHWEEQPIALYPDANGAMYSGCMVVDEDNTSGFFDGIQGGGLVALITADGNGERIKLAYSTDEGKTWTKVDEIAADWTDDPLNDAAFRDPKVFRWEGKWFMVVAGGPLRIYSSDNLREWTCEATYADLHTECPDLYPIEAPDGQIKWVLSRGGRFYKIGDFKTVNGKWRFVPDDDYVNSDGVMNFGRDFYAAMTYYVQDFGTTANPNLPELIELNWMNTWDDYCNQVAEAVGQDFNGTFNLNLKLGLKKDDSKYVLTQTPISGYETLRQTSEKQEWKQVTVETNNTLLKDFVGDTYEIIAKFYPGEGTRKVGFKVRTGEDEETLVVYDLETQNLSIDRSNSGVIISSKFAETTSQTVAPNADGTVDLHIYVDKACVEAFAQDYTAAGSVQIFPSPVSVGAAVLVEGNPAKADITIYPLSSIWTDKAEITEPQYIGTTAAAEQKMYVGDTLKLNAYVLPITVSQEMTWSVQEGKDVAKVDASGTVTALKKGTAVIVAASKAAPELTTEFAIEVTENNFNTNLSGFVNVNGNWHIDDETLSVSNGGQNDYYMSAEAVEGDFTLETNISYTAGLINLFLASEDLNPHLGAGAYTIQFGYDTNVRLFPFGYNDFATGTLVSRINDGEYHHVKVVKEGQTVTVYVDEAKCLEHTFDAVETFFAKGYVGIGLWDGALDVQEFFVSPLEEEPDPTEPTEPEPTEPEPTEPEPTEPEPTEPEPTEPEPTEPEPTEPADPDADGDGIPDSFGAYQENGIYILDNCYGYVFEIDDVNGTIDGEDITLITTQTAYESCNPSWAISVQLRPTDDGSYEVVKVVECPGSVSAAGITLQTNDVVLVVHSAASCPGDYENWLSKIAAVALKEGDIIEIASDNTTAAVIGPAEEEPTPIQITLQPTDVAVRPGEAAVVTLEATGDGLTYTWYFKNSGASSFKKTTAFTGPTYSVTMNESRSGRQVYCLVMDQYGNRVQSDIVMLSMYTTPLEIVTQPESVTVAEGETASATVEAAGDGLTYTWYYRNSGATQFSATTTFTGPVYYITMNDARDGRQIYCVIGDMYGNEVTTDIVTLSMVKNVATIVKQPVDVEVEAGELAEVTLEATGDDLTYSWYYKNAGAASFKKTTAFTGPSYSVVMNESRSGRQVYCLVMDRYGNRAQSDVVTLTMHTTPLELLAQPEDVTVAEGETAVVTLEAIGDGLTYEWYYKSATGSKFTKTTTFTGPSYSIMMNAARSGRQVYCVITDAYGNSLTTRTVTLSMEQVEEAPLVLVAQPEGFTIAKGDVGEVYVEATGDGLTYEWYYKSATGSQFTKTDTFTGPAYTLTMSAARAGRHVYCVVTDKYGESIQTDIVTLNMESELELLDQPEDVTAAIGETAVVTADVVGEDLTYSWYYRDAGTTAFKKTTSFTGDTYSLKMTAARAGRQVYCVVSDAEGNVVVTDIVTLSVPG